MLFYLEEDKGFLDSLTAGGMKIADCVRFPVTLHKS